MMKNNISLRWYNYSSNKTREWNQLKYTYNTCALSKHIGHMCMRLGNGRERRGFGLRAEYTYVHVASTVHMYCMYPAILNRNQTFSER